MLELISMKKHKYCVSVIQILQENNKFLPWFCIFCHFSTHNTLSTTIQSANILFWHIYSVQETSVKICHLLYTNHHFFLQSQTCTFFRLVIFRPTYITNTSDKLFPVYQTCSHISKSNHLWYHKKHLIHLKNENAKTLLN